MRKVFLFLIAVLIQINLFAQDYTPFDFENGIWICYEGIFGGEIQTYDIQYYSDGDTIIDDARYFKFMEYRIKTSYGNPYASIVYNRYCGAIRNNENRQVEFIDKNNNEPSIIYDFNLSLGDTIKNGYGSNEFQTEPLVVLSIDSVEYCGKFHRSYNLNDSSFIYQKIIEGIGFSSGLMNPFFFQFEQNSHLVCYTEKNNGYCEQCNLLLSNKPLSSKNNVRMYPNPSSGLVHFRTIEDIISFEVINQSGQVCKCGENIYSKEFSFNFGLETGVYMIKIKAQEQQIYMDKLIIQR